MDSLLEGMAIVVVILQQRTSFLQSAEKRLCCGQNWAYKYAYTLREALPTRHWH